MNHHAAPFNWWNWCGTLPKLQVSKHFAFYGIRRDERHEERSRRRWNPGVHGIRDAWIVEHYTQTLELAYREMRDAGWPAPFATDLTGRIPVFLFAVDDPVVKCRTPQFAELEIGRRYMPVLALPSRCRQTTEIAAKHYTASCGVHELSHAMSTGCLPYRLDITEQSKRPAGGWELFRAWLWFDEGRAVAAEARFLRQNDSWKSYGLDWVDRPERSLDDWEARYQAAFFIRYLERYMEARGRKNFSSLVWEKSRTIWDSVTNQTVRPLTALGALAKTLHEHGQTFASPHIPDVFASSFCMDSYFLCLPGTADSDPAAFLTYRERAITRSWSVARGKPMDARQNSETTSLPQFACRYFRFTPQDNAGRLSVRVKTELDANLKAELALVRTKTLERVPQPPASRANSNGGLLLTCQSDQDLSDVTFDHAVLVVSHCPDLLSSGPVAKPVVGFTVSSSCS